MMLGLLPCSPDLFGCKQPHRNVGKSKTSRVRGLSGTFQVVETWQPHERSSSTDTRNDGPPSYNKLFDITPAFHHAQPRSQPNSKVSSRPQLPSRPPNPPPPPSKPPKPLPAASTPDPPTCFPESSPHSPTSPPQRDASPSPLLRRSPPHLPAPASQPRLPLAHAWRRRRCARSSSLCPAASKWG